MRIKYIHSAFETGGPMATEFAWVIEGAWSPTSRPMYWRGFTLFSEDIEMAIRFARKEDAERVFNQIPALCDMNVRICEHGWSALPTRERGGADE